MNICKNCRFWVRSNQKDVLPYIGTCSNENIRDISSNFSIWDGSIESAEMKSNQLGAHDFEAYQTIIYVGEDFGCIHFEEKNA